MGTLIENGQALVLQAGEFTSDPRQGWRQTITARGNLVACANLAIQLAAAGFKVRDRNLGNGIGEVSYEINSLQNSPEVPQDLWQLPGSVMQKSIYEHPNSISLDQTYPGILVAIQAAFQSGSSDPSVGLKIIYTGNAAALSDERTLAIAYLLGRGTDHFDYSRYALRHTQTVSQVYTNELNDTNSENVYTTTQLLTECASFPSPLPGRMVAKIQAVDAAAQAGFTAPTGYTWGWKKDPSTETTVANYKIEITTDYQFDLWNTGYLYNLYGTGAPEV